MPILCPACGLNVKSTARWPPHLALGLLSKITGIAMPDQTIEIRRISRFEMRQTKQLFALCFDPSQLDSFSQFLEKDNQRYLLLELDGELIGGCGFTVSYSRVAFISWLMIAPPLRRQGFGRLIVDQIIFQIRTNKKVRTIEALASRSSQGFFSKYGFNLNSVRENFWGEGLDLYRMQITYKKQWVKFG